MCGSQHVQVKSNESAERGRFVKWLEYVSIAEAVVIRLGGLILIAIFIGKAILHALAR
jgi:hypothetical protein